MTHNLLLGDSDIENSYSTEDFYVKPEKKYTYLQQIYNLFMYIIYGQEPNDNYQ